jgi:hypothetical protein
MRLNLGKLRRRTLTAGLMLAALASRVLIPLGFMPAGDGPSWIEICRDGLPAGLIAQLEPARADSTGMESMGMDPMPADAMGAHHHRGSPSQTEHCVFGAASGAGPIPHLPHSGDVSCARLLPAAAFASVALVIRGVHLPQPRAPPALLS